MNPERARRRAQPLVIRETDSRDGAAQACLGAYYDELDRLNLPGYDRAVVAHADSLLMPPTGVVLLAMLGGAPIGCGALLFRSADVAEIKRMWVAPTGRGRGVGRQLLAALEERARTAGCRHVRLETRRELADAVRLYRRHGYRETRPFHNVAWIHHWMEKALP